MMFHFLQTNNYGFDSLFYDGDAELMVLIKITIDQSHERPYEKLIGFIEQNPTFDSYHEKYYRFFGKLKKTLVSTFVFQWMTDKIYDYSINLTGNQTETVNLKNSRQFQIYSFHHQLLKTIEEKRKLK